MEKIKKLEELSKIVKDLRNQNKKIVHCHGVFDLLHIGHIRYLEQAKKMGDILIVTITSDKYVDKGPHRPAFTENLRAEAIASLKCVDYTAINPWETAENTLRLLRPHVYVKGSEFKKITTDITGRIGRELKVVDEIKATLAFTEDVVFSSTNLINNYLSAFPDEIDKYLKIFRNRFSLDEIMLLLEKVSTLNVLVIGDTILDEYQFCNAIGKSSKEPILALKYETHDLFAGGVLAVANHVANFVNNVSLITIIGERDSHEGFIRSQLNSKISPCFLIQDKAPTIIKRRFIEGYTLNKLFEIYVMDDSGLTDDKDNDLCELLEENILQYDLVIVTDYGHGAISERAKKILMNKSNFLSVNTQANAGNRGFHTISKYPHADYCCLTEYEIRLDLRDLKSDITPLVNQTMKKYNYPRMAITSGVKGCTVYEQNKYVRIPAFTRNVVDRIGAGDAFFAITSLLSALGENIEVVGFLGNTVGALAVEILGNKKSIDMSSVKKYITSLLK